MRARAVSILIVLIAFALSFPARAAPTVLPVRTFTDTGIRLTDIVWTGHQFLYIENTTNRAFRSGPSGAPLTPLAAMPRQVEETRCVVSLGGHGYPARTIFCHSPTNRIYRMDLDGRHLSLLAVIPHMPRSDGAITFDQVGRFGYRLLVATGRSGAGNAPGGSVFTVSPGGSIRLIGRYRAPGGVDEIAVAPARFGSVAGQVLLPVDAGPHGSLLAMDPAGHVRTLASLPDGPNPITVLSPGLTPRAGTARPGLYVTDTTSHLVYRIPAAALQPYRGDVLVGSELKADFWVIAPQGRGVRVRRVRTGLPPRSYNLEAAVYITR